MRELRLVRTPEDRRLYDLRGVGTLRVGRWPSREVEVEAGGASYVFSRRGGRRFSVAAVDRSTGEEVAEMLMRPVFKDARTLWRWKTVEWELRPSFEDSTRYALARPGDEREVVTVETSAWGRRPVPVAVDDATTTDAGLVLFVVFAVRVLTDEMTASAASGGGGGGG